MHGRFRQLEMYHFSTMGRQFLRSNKGITLFLFSVVSCFSAVDLLSSGLCRFSMWTSCLSMCHTDLQHVVCALDAILLQQDGKHHSKLPASYLSDGKIKANQNKICAPQLLSWSMAGPPEGEWLSQLCHQTTLSLISAVCSPPHESFYLPERPFPWLTLAFPLLIISPAP